VCFTPSQQDGEKTAVGIAILERSIACYCSPLYGWPAPTERALLDWRRVIHEKRSHKNRDTGN
jgi:hypothetical protein